MNAPAAFVTGAGRGIGRLITQALAIDGFTVAGFARTGKDLDSPHSIPHTGRLLTYQLDVTQPTDVRSGLLGPSRRRATQPSS